MARLVVFYALPRFLPDAGWRPETEAAVGTPDQADDPRRGGRAGTQASHGCMRMMPSAVKDLMGRVEVGDEVFIRR